VYVDGEDEDEGRISGVRLASGSEEPLAFCSDSAWLGMTGDEKFRAAYGTVAVAPRLFERRGRVTSASS